MQQVPSHPDAAPDGEQPVAEHTAGRGGKIDRIAQQSRALLDDVKDWVDLRLQLARLEIMEELEEKKTAAVAGVVLTVLGLLALVFALVAAALGLGVWLGHPAWGFLAVTLVLVLVAGFVYLLYFGRPKKPPRTSEAEDAEAGPKQLAAGASEQRRLPS